MFAQSYAIKVRVIWIWPSYWPKVPTTIYQLQNVQRLEMLMNHLSFFQWNRGLFFLIFGPIGRLRHNLDLSKGLTEQISNDLMKNTGVRNKSESHLLFPVCFLRLFIDIMKRCIIMYKVQNKMNIWMCNMQKSTFMFKFRDKLITLWLKGLDTHLVLWDVHLWAGLRKKKIYQNLFL